MVAGQLDLEKKRTFDLVVSGNCKTGPSDAKVSFIVDGEETAPDFFDLKQGKIVFAEPHPMGTITMPKGYQSFVKISLQSINAENSEESQKWVCLGIRKKDTKEYLEYLHMPSKLETHIEMYSEDIVELIPLVSAVDLSNTENSYVAVEPGKEIGKHSKFSGLSGDIKFSAVYRIDVQNVAWLTELDCDMLNDGCTIFNMGSLGVGPIGTYTDDQMVGMVGFNGLLTHSSDGKTWVADVGQISQSTTGDWYAAPKYNGDTWCAVKSRTSEVRYLEKDSTTWEQSEGQVEAHCLEFGEHIFMTIGRADGKVYTSADAIAWTNIGSVPSMEAKSSMEGYNILIHGDGKWICGDHLGNLHQSENTGKTWSAIKESDLNTILNRDVGFYGGCYAHGYFYIAGTNSIAKSPDGKKWTKVVGGLEITQQAVYTNVTYYKGKLYTFRMDGKKYAVGMP